MEAGLLAPPPSISLHSIEVLAPLNSQFSILDALLLHTESKLKRRQARPSIRVISEQLQPRNAATIGHTAWEEMPL